MLMIMFSGSWSRLGCGLEVSFLVRWNSRVGSLESVVEVCSSLHTLTQSHSFMTWYAISVMINMYPISISNAHIHFAKTPQTSPHIRVQYLSRNGRPQLQMLVAYVMIRNVRHQSFTVKYRFRFSSYMYWDEENLNLYFIVNYCVTCLFACHKFCLVTAMPFLLSIFTII